MEENAVRESDESLSELPRDALLIGLSSEVPGGIDGDELQLNNTPENVRHNPDPSELELSPVGLGAQHVVAYGVVPLAVEPKETLSSDNFFDISAAAEEPPLEDTLSFDADGYLQKQRARVYQIQTLKERIESRPIPSYAAELEAEAAEDQTALTLAHVSVETLEQQQRQLEQEQAHALQEERRKQAIRQRLIRECEEEAKEAVLRDAEKASQVLR
jgi:hypothetical protein